MLDRVQWFVAGMSIALSVQLSQTVVAAVSTGKVVQTAQTNNSDAAAVAAFKAALAKEVFIKGMELYQQGTAEARRSAITNFEQTLKLSR